MALVILMAWCKTVASSVREQWGCHTIVPGGWCQWVSAPWWMVGVVGGCGWGTPSLTYIFSIWTIFLLLNFESWPCLPFYLDLVGSHFEHPPFLACRWPFCLPKLSNLSFQSDLVGFHFELQAAHPYCLLPALPQSARLITHWSYSHLASSIYKFSF